MYVLITGSTAGFGPVISSYYASWLFLVLRDRSSDRLNSSKSSLLLSYDVDILCVSEDVKFSLPFESSLALNVDSNIIPRIIVHHLGGTCGLGMATSEVDCWLSVLTLNASKQSHK